MVKKELMMHVAFDVPMSKLGLFTDLLQNEVSNLEIKQAQEGVFTTKHYRGPNKTASQAGKGVSFKVAADLMTKIGIGGKITTSSKGEGNLAAALKAAGLSPNTNTPLASQLTSLGYLKKESQGVYSVVKIPETK